ncbi:hypothetical protein KKG72_09835 [bacterium]|nr:hypothetical protein [bacterium]MBU1993879.1 hypothetical protein [bacterium]
MKSFLAFLLLALLAFSGCSKPKSAVVEDFSPSWIMNPNQNGKVGAVGTAYRHYKGLSYQRNLAITRALDEMALQRGVKVSLSMIKKEHLKNDNVSTTIDIDSSYTSDSSTITAHIEEAWQDPKTQEFFIWLVLD